MYSYLSLADQIIHGTVATVEQVLATGVDVNEIDEYGFTPLIETAIVDNIDMAQLLIAHGAEVNGQDMTGRTALHWTVDNNNQAFTELLLSYGANPNAYTNAGQPALIYPLLRNQLELKKLLYDHGADLHLAQDFINTKLLGHRFEMLGFTEIVDSKGRFIPIDYEGFFLEFTINTIHNSLINYRRSFASKYLRPFASQLQTIIAAFSDAAELVRFQHYLIDVEKHTIKLHRLLDKDLLVLPVANEGHAIIFIKFGNLLAKCDRGYNSKREGSVVIYKITNRLLLNRKFLKDFLYKVHPREYMQYGINEYLGLKTLITLPLPAQIIGNCSWANVEATIPTLFFMLLLAQANSAEQTQAAQEKALSFYNHWLRWDQDRAIDECIHSFVQASPARKASKAAILANILLYKCRYTEMADLARAEKILKVLVEKPYRYILKSYVAVFCQQRKNVLGENLKLILDHFGVNV